MAIANSWQRRLVGDLPYGSALKQGTGWNPIHAVPDQGTGRNIAPDGTSNLVDSDLTNEESYGFTNEDMFLFGDPPGYGAENPRELGLNDRPDWGTDEGTRADMPDDYPSWGLVNTFNGSNAELPVGIPGGTIIRAKEVGAVASNTANVLPDEDVAQGWMNKQHGGVEDAVVSDQSQYEMQTSMMQRDQTRAGSQSSGTASEYSAPIKSRITGQKLRFWSGEQRHYDMAPKAQEQMIRPFHLRTAGTGDPALMQANEFYVSQPLQRTVPADPDQGPVLPVSQNPDVYASTTYGFTAEDAVW